MSSSRRVAYDHPSPPPPIATLAHSPALSASSMDTPPPQRYSTTNNYHPYSYPDPHHYQQQQQQQHQPQHTAYHSLPGQSSGLPAIIHTDDAATKLSDRVRRRCFNCCTTDTSTWRRSNLSPGKVLCNKCGLFERTHSRPRPEQFPHKRGPLASSALRRTPPGGGGGPGMGVNDHHHHHHHLPPIHYNNNPPTNTNSVAPNNNYPHPHSQLGHSTSTSTLPPINQPRILPGVQSWLNEPALPPLSHSPHSLSHPHSHQRPASASLGLSDSRRSLPTSLLPSLSNSSSSSSAPPTRLHSPPTSASTAPSTQPHSHSNGDPSSSNSYVSSTTASPLLPGTPLLNASTPTNNNNNNNNPNPENSLSNGETV